MTRYRQRNSLQLIILGVRAALDGATPGLLIAPKVGSGLLPCKSVGGQNWQVLAIRVRIKHPYCARSAPQA
jgi:hypothetical protein